MLADFRESLRHSIRILADFEPMLVERPAYTRLMAQLDSANTENPGGRVAEIVGTLSELIEG